MRKNQIPILLARISMFTAIVSISSLIVSWSSRLIFESGEKGIGFFVTAFVCSAIALGTGYSGIKKIDDKRERRKAWIGAIGGGILFVPMGAVAIILLIIWIFG